MRRDLKGSVSSSSSATESDDGPGSLRHGPIALLGLVTICVYGAWYYAFGVLLDPILADTGWNEAVLAASFSLGILGIGVGSLLGGRLLDRLGTRWVFGLAALVGGGALLLATVATNVVVFVMASALGMGVFGALGFYHVSMAAVVRLHPAESGRAIAALTIWGALASPIYLPLAAWLVERYGWRATSQMLVASAIVMLMVAAALLPRPATLPDLGPPPGLRTVARAAVGTAEARAFTLAVALIGVTISILLSYQVPIMSAAGLPLTTAATMAGVRGFSQLGGRLPLGFLLKRIHARTALFIALGAVTVGTLLLGVAGTVPVALLFAVVAGFGIGAYSPLQGIYAAELFDHRAIGATMGLYTSVSMLAGSIGPLAAGVIVEVTGDRRWVAVAASVSAVASLLVLATARRSAAQVSQAPLRS